MPLTQERACCRSCSELTTSSCCIFSIHCSVRAKANFPGSSQLMRASGERGRRYTGAGPVLPNEDSFKSSFCPGALPQTGLDVFRTSPQSEALNQSSFLPFHPYPQRCRRASWFEALPAYFTGAMLSFLILSCHQLPRGPELTKHIKYWAQNKDSGNVSSYCYNYGLIKLMTPVTEDTLRGACSHGSLI